MRGAGVQGRWRDDDERAMGMASTCSVSSDMVWMDGRRCRGGRKGVMGGLWVKEGEEKGRRLMGGCG